MAFEMNEEDYLAHYGTLTYSGRYRWGSGEDPYQRLNRFLGETVRMKQEGYSEAEIAKAFGLKNSTELRTHKTIANYDRAYLDYTRAVNLREQGYGHTEIAKKMGWGADKESKVRKILAPHYLDRQQRFEASLSSLREQVNKKEIVDVGTGVQEALKLKETEKNKIVRALQMEGYNKYIIKERQAGTGEQTSTMVLTKPDIQWKEAFDRRADIKPFSGDIDMAREGNMLGFVKPKQLAKNRVDIVYGDEGGAESDGMIYLRPGVKDLSLGANHYAQVRIKVGPDHYMKGMAIYKDGLPDGVDVQFHTNKNRDVPIYGDKKSSILKPLKDDPENPFGASIARQITEGEGKNRKATSVCNIVNDESDWNKWSKNLPSQFLSKQSDKLIRTQLELTQSNRRSELDDIKALNNPVVRKHMLMKYADSADAAAVHLKAAALARQKTHVLLAVPEMKSTEVYAPNFKNGERVVLVRFPHAGNFEIPELVVNNRQKDAKGLIGTAQSAIGINSKVAERLSGADFDGDTVLVIPNNSGAVKTSNPLKGLENFSPHTQYKEVPGMKVMTKKGTGTEMGKVSNLITDMSIAGATPSEMARAVRHSMVVIDAEKHRLNYKQSEIDNGIAALKKKYQSGGASTIISRAKGRAQVPEREPRKARDGGPIADDGSLVYTPTNRTYIDPKTGKEVAAITRGTKMEFAKDARTLSSGHPVEELYATHANIMKGLANQARAEYKRTPNLKYSPEAKVKYSKEVAELDEALRKAKSNAPLERLANRAANARVKAMLDENPGIEADDLKKYRGRALTAARDRVGAKKARIEPTDAQWKAIQEGAISNHKLEEILRHGNQEVIVSLATPKNKQKLSTSKIGMIKSMAARGYTQAEIAERLGISTSTVNEYT